MDAGLEMASSPVMRMPSPAWRFAVGIPEGSRNLSLVVMDAGDGHWEDYATGVEAGWVRVR